MLKFSICTQPTDETCGPTCLHAIYNYYQYDISLAEVIKGVERSDSGGTLCPLLGKHALSHGFNATMYVNNMVLFDPTWFKKGVVPNEALLFKLRAQEKYKKERAIIQSSRACQDFLTLGGTVRFQTLDVPLLKEYFEREVPVLTGLSSTYLYRTARECFTSNGESFFDDVRGTPSGHFVVLIGYDAKKKKIMVADPYMETSFSDDNYYKVSQAKLFNAIMLGVVTYDSTLLVIEPKK
jgi:hypothetical protein